MDGYVPNGDAGRQRCHSPVSLVSGRPVSRTVTVVRSIVDLYRDRDIPFLAGSVAYAAFVSLIPLVLLLVIVASAVGGESFRQYVIDLAAQYLTPSALGIVESSITDSSSQVGFSLLGGVALLWAVLKVFRTLDKAFSELYSAETSDGFLRQIKDGLVVVGTMTVAIVGMVALGTLVALAPSLSLTVTDPPVVRALTFVALVVGLTVAFLPMYYVFPNVSVSLREVVPGAVVAALGWTILQSLFQVYVSLASPGRLYGVIGGVILFITWLYFGAVVVLLGGAVNVVLSGRARAVGAAAESTTAGA